MATKKTSTNVVRAQATKATTAAARRAEELLREIARRKARIAEDFYDIGEALREIKKKKLYVALGHGSFAELLAARKVMSARTADKLIEVVEAIPRTRAQELGSERSYALARLAATTPELDDVESILEEGVRVGGKKKAVAQLSTRELEETIRAVRAPKKPDAEQKAAAKVAREVQALLRSKGARKLSAVVEREKGAWWLEIRVPLEQHQVLIGKRLRA